MEMNPRMGSSIDWSFGILTSRKVEKYNAWRLKEIWKVGGVDSFLVILHPQAKRSQTFGLSMEVLAYGTYP